MKRSGACGSASPFPTRATAKKVRGEWAPKVSHMPLQDHPYTRCSSLGHSTPTVWSKEGEMLLRIWIGITKTKGQMASWRKVKMSRISNSACALKQCCCFFASSSKMKLILNQFHTTKCAARRTRHKTKSKISVLFHSKIFFIFFYFLRKKEGGRVVVVQKERSNLKDSCSAILRIEHYDPCSGFPHLKFCWSPLATPFPQY